jgi:hypothetical protein
VRPTYWLLPPRTTGSITLKLKRTSPVALVRPEFFPGYGPAFKGMLAPDAKVSSSKFRGSRSS